MNLTAMHEWLLIAFTVWMALQLGGGLYEKQVIVPVWQKVSPSELQKALEQTGQKASATRFWMFVSPVVALLALANLYVAWQLPDSEIRNWWIAAAAISTLYSTFTYSYFVPRMIRMWKASSLPKAEVKSMLVWWTRLNYLRLAMGVAAFFSAVWTLRLYT